MNKDSSTSKNIKKVSKVKDVAKIKTTTEEKYITVSEFSKLLKTTEKLVKEIKLLHERIDDIEDLLDETEGSCSGSGSSEGSINLVERGRTGRPKSPIN